MTKDFTHIWVKGWRFDLPPSEEAKQLRMIGWELEPSIGMFITGEGKALSLDMSKVRAISEEERRKKARQLEPIKSAVLDLLDGGCYE